METEGRRWRRGVGREIGSGWEPRRVGLFSLSFPIFTLSSIPPILRKRAKKGRGRGSSK